MKQKTIINKFGWILMAIGGVMILPSIIMSLLIVLTLLTFYTIDFVVLIFQDTLQSFSVIPLMIWGLIIGAIGMVLRNIK